MSENAPVAQEPIVIKSAKDVDGLLKELNELANTIAAAAAVRDQEIKSAKEDFLAATATSATRQEEILLALKSYLLPRRRSWLRRFGQVAKLENGVVKWNNIGASLVTTKDEAPVIDALLNIRGGKKFLRIKWEIERKAFSVASPGLLKRLKPLGVLYTSQESLTVKAGNHPAIQLDQRPYPRPR